MKWSYGRTRGTLAAVMAAVAVGACSGPSPRLETGWKDVPVDLVLGAKARAVAEAPIPPLMGPVPTTGFGRPRFPTTVEGTPTTTGRGPRPPLPCPTRNFLDPPKRAARNFVEGPPQPAEYTFRTQGLFFAVNPLGESPARGIPSPESQVVVTDVAEEPTGGFVFSTVVANQALGTTTTTYRVLPTPVPSANPPHGVPPDLPRPAGASSALYLAAMRQEGSPVPFRPTYPGIPIVRLPLEIGSTFDAVGSDGTSTVSWRSKVLDTAVVDACGTPLHAYVVELTNGRVVNGDGGESVTFTSRMSIAPQYGALAIQVETAVDSTGAPPAVLAQRRVSMTINQEPKLP